MSVFYIIIIIGVFFLPPCSFFFVPFKQAKLNFIFQLADKNSDLFINLAEMVMIMHSSSRGFSRMKEIEAPPLFKIEEIVNEGFNHPEVHLDERGEMAMPDVIFMASANESLRNYLSNLDSSAGADIGNLYKQQARILRELAMIDAVLDTRERHERDMAVDEEIYEKERGGDIKHIGTLRKHRCCFACSFPFVSYLSFFFF